MIEKVTVLENDPRSYPIVIGEDNYLEITSYLKEFGIGKKILVLTHPSINALYGCSLLKILKNTFDCFVLEVPEGEKSKSFSVVETVLNTLLENYFERNDTLISLGGGVIGDLGGFAASIYLRGINFIQCPTTLLSQVDAAIGGKTGINHEKGKNLIGSFYQPRMTFINIATLNTLPKNELLSGLAEVVKYGVIVNKPLFNYISRFVKTFSELTPSSKTQAWQHIIVESCKNKATIVSEDEKESDVRAILNFGHTIGHAIEALSSFSKYSHGECVAIGMKAALNISLSLDLISSNDVNEILTLLTALGFGLSVKGVTLEQIKSKLLLDKKVKNGKVRFVLATGIGAVIVSDKISDSILDSSIRTILA
jgi:3-dehydroquinate synthase